jgi:chromosome segregation protein
LRPPAAIAAERVRNVGTAGQDERRGRDPDAIEAEAHAIQESERRLAAEVATRAETLARASARAPQAEAGHTAEAEKAVRGSAASDRRPPRGAGEARPARSTRSSSTTEAAGSEIERLSLGG